MNIFDLVGGREDDSVYQELERTNGIRHYNFLDSIISASLAISNHEVSETLIKAINFHAIACLHDSAGDYRNVSVTVGSYNPPSYDRVPVLMEEFVATANYVWTDADPVALSSYVMWAINHIHPFVNGNSRTSRAMFFYVLCMKLSTKLEIHLPELIRTRFRSDYINALKAVDDSLAQSLDITPLADLMNRIIIEAISPAIVG